MSRAVAEFAAAVEDFTTDTADVHTGPIAEKRNLFRMRVLLLTGQLAQLRLTETSIDLAAEEGLRVLAETQQHFLALLDLEREHGARS